MMAHPVLRRMVVFGLPTAAFLGHCVVQTAFVAPFTAVAVLIGLFLAKLPLWAEKCFLLLGKHSTNIWLVHMFFYLNLFKDFVFFAKYPILVLALMLVVCFAASMVIECLNQPVLTHIERKKRKEARR
jgi:surface polysaccharide O-acyltransferase-like enzyme